MISTIELVTLQTPTPTLEPSPVMPDIHVMGMNQQTRRPPRIACIPQQTLEGEVFSVEHDFAAQRVLRHVGKHRPQPVQL